MTVLAKPRRALGLVAALAALSSAATPSAAEDGAFSAHATWSAEGSFHQTGPDEATFVGVLSGPLYVDDGTGAVEAGAMLCPGRLRVNLADLSQDGSADCTILTAEGERIYADFSCEGRYREGCFGEFRIVGGTGGREGISGGGPVEFLNAMPDWTATPGNRVTTAAAGLVRWPSLTVRLP